MGNKNQKQKAGKESTQIQAQTINVYNGITEARAREISRETMHQVLEQCAVESGAVAQKRIEEFEEMVLPRIASIEKDYASFSDPAFQVLYRKTQISAACSGRSLDYEMLSELIAHRINNKGDTKKKASIEKAVEIIDKIDEDALCGLTMMHVISWFNPTSGNISEGLSVINDIYNRVQYMDLPIGRTDWIDNLDILGAARMQYVATLKRFVDYISHTMNGYVCCGIKKDSPQYERVITDLKEVDLSESFLVDNELLDGYVRIPVVAKDRIGYLQRTVSANICGNFIAFPKHLLDQQKTVLTEVYNKYDTTPSLVQTVKERFADKLSSFDAIHKAQLWWDQLNPCFRVTSIGKAIAQANAKRIDRTLPDLD